MGLVSMGLSLITDRSLCLFFNITGLPCPSCGMTRAWRQVTALKIKRAFDCHPLFWIIPLIPLCSFLGECKKNWEKYINIVWIAIAFIFMIVWFIRVMLALG